MKTYINFHVLSTTFYHAKIFVVFIKLRKLQKFSPSKLIMYNYMVTS